jgi:hypothetical protein
LVDGGDCTMWMYIGYWVVNLEMFNSGKTWCTNIHQKETVITKNNGILEDPFYHSTSLKLKISGIKRRGQIFA